MYDCDYVINTAAETHVGNSIANSDEFVQSNVNGVHNLLELIKNHRGENSKKPIFLHFSTDEVYGDIANNNLRASEKSQYIPSSPYAATKASSDHLIRSYIRTYKLPAVISNCSNNYGPRQHPEKLIPKIIYNILNNLPIPIYGKGNNSREWLYVNDHCKALEILALNGKIGENYNIGSNINISNFFST